MKAKNINITGKKTSKGRQDNIKRESRNQMEDEGQANDEDTLHVAEFAKEE